MLQPLPDSKASIMNRSAEKVDREAQVVDVPYFSIIITTYGRSELLKQAVDSVIQQSYANWHLIIVDDCSPGVAPAFDDPRVSVIRNEVNLGKAASVNRALTLATGQVVAFLDDDDLWAQDRLLHARSAHDRFAVVSCLSGRHGQSATRSKRTLERKRRSQVAQGREHGPIGSMCATSVRLDLCPPFDEKFAACEDIDWAIRIWQETHSVGVIAFEDFLWRKHDGPRHGNGSEARVAGMLLLLAKHKDYYRDHPVAHATRLYLLANRLRRGRDPKRALRYAVLSIITRPTTGGLKTMVRTVRAILMAKRMREGGIYK